MNKYESIVPENITSNTFEYRGGGASIEIESSSVYDGWSYALHAHRLDAPWMFFNKDHFAATANTAPPHYVGIRSSRPLMINQFDFTSEYDGVYMTAKDYQIESSMDGETWNTLYTGTIPNTSSDYVETCKFKSMVCRWIRCHILTTYDQRGWKWFAGGNFKIYGYYPRMTLYTNPDVYVIPKTE